MRAVSIVIGILVVAAVGVAGYWTGQQTAPSAGESTTSGQISTKAVEVAGDKGFPLAVTFDVPAAWSIAESLDQFGDSKAAAGTLSDAPLFSIASDVVVYEASSLEQIDVTVFEGDVTSQLQTTITGASGAKVTTTSATVAGKTATVFTDEANGYEGNERYVFTTTHNDATYTWLISRQGQGSTAFDEGVATFLESLAFNEVDFSADPQG